MSGRLGVSKAFNRPRTLSPLYQNNYDGVSDTGGASNSASYSKLERELKSLKEENAELRSELNDTRITLKQLISESSHEKFDERRINLLKLQLIQLERQIAILNEALGHRQEASQDVENAMAWLADKLRSYIAADVKGPMVPIARSDLTSMTEVSESARIKLFKALEGSSKDSVGRDLLFLNPFLGGKHTQGEPLSLLDISLQRMDYINLRHVAQLESKLCQLYKELIRVHEHIQNIKPKSLFAGHLGCAEIDRMETVLLKTCVMLKDITDDLMALSLLCPSSPWPVLKRPLTKEVPVERVIAALPVLPHSKEEEVKHIIEACLHTCNHRQFLLTKQMAVLTEELAFHRSVYDLQMQYTQALLDAVRKGYGEFETSIKSIICKPLKDSLDAYKHLKNSASEDAFREFLIIMKANEEQLTSVVETFNSQCFDSAEYGSMAISKFGGEFLDKINSLVRKCQIERDAKMKAHKTVEEEQTKKDLELQHLIEILENKYEKTWTPKTSMEYKGSEPKSFLDKQDASSHKGTAHNEVARENSVRESSHLVEVQDVKHLDTSSKLNQHINDPTVLKSFLNDDDEACKFKPDSGNYDPKNRTDCSKEMIHGCSLSAPDATMCNTHYDNKGRKNQWKPDKAWVNDFSGLSDKTETLPSRTNLLEGDSCINTVSQNKEHPKSSSQTAKNVNTNEKPPVKSGKNEHKIQKPSSCEPKLSVAKRTLKLRRSGSLPKPDSVECVCDSSLLKTDTSNLELDKFSIQNQPSHPGHRLPNSDGNIGESARYHEKQKF